MVSDEYEVYALRYATRPQNTAAESYHRFELYGADDHLIGMDYFIWVIRRGLDVVVVDTGFDEVRGSARGRRWTTPPAQLLERVGVRPDAVGTVILTHLHYDHSGNIALFPNARFIMSTAEYDYWTGPYSDRPAIAWPAETEEIEQVKRLRRDGRLDLIGESLSLSPGLDVITLPGHTPGQLIVRVGASEAIVLTSDAMHHHAEIELDRPFHIYDDLRSIFHSYEYLRALAADTGVRLVPGHDPAVMHDYMASAPDCLDLTRPVAGRVHRPAT